MQSSCLPSKSMPLDSYSHWKPFSSSTYTFSSSSQQSNFLFPRTKKYRQQSRSLCIVSGSDSGDSNSQDEEGDSLGVKAALSMLKFYKREISPIMPKSCRYIPTCSEYSMIAYKKYGVVKGTVLTAWRLCRCNPLGGSGFDPPRWFDEESPPQE
ncbi:UPF0161 protein At3g09310 isoform X2 [Solanum dulcamara]|uniref:UPF0161 protein At3g09310 isoform X2 n=1 Tax=Solanum dulcamara TaxID=45834 RepID=UPI002486CD14|nr:UPF0161 protein At3g09310 isoform X2 [Solanum dulcamara]